MKRAVITGLGIVSSIGNNKNEVIDSLKMGRSGVRFSEEYQELDFRSHVHAPVDIDLDQFIDRKLKRFMGDAAAYAYIAMGQAIDDANLSEDLVSNPRTGLIVGSGGSSTENMLLVTDTQRERGARKVGPTMVPRIMASTVSACLAVAYKTKGVNYSISSACATSTHCIGNAYEQIQMGKQDIIFAGGGEELHWTSSLLFDSMGALSSKYNQAPDKASRAFDAERDGFVISGGGGVVVVEELEHALARNATIYAEIVGYGATSDGFDMVKPSGEGAKRCMEMAMPEHGSIDYINAHATSTPAGDVAELKAIKEIFTDQIPKINSTKSLTGHGLGCAGVNEAIYSLLMMHEGFISTSANITTLDDAAAGLPIVTERIDDIDINTIMSNSFGFGGTNASLALQRYQS